MVQRHPQLQKVIDEVVDNINDLAVAKLIENIRKGDFNSIKYYLENKGQGHGFGQRKLAFSDGEGNVMVPGVLVVPKRELDADAWAQRYQLN